MPKICAVLKCKFTGRHPERKFFRFPMLNRSSKKVLAMSQTRQDAWIKALNRADFFPHQYKSAVVCDMHFESGRAAALTDINNIDWVPSWNLGYKIERVEAVEDISPQSAEISGLQTIAGDQQAIRKADEDRTDFVSDECLESSEHSDECRSKETQTPTVVTFSASTQTDYIYTGVSTDIVVSLEEKVAYLQEMLNRQNVTLGNLRGNDKKTKFFTGLSHFTTLEALFELVSPHIKESRKLTKFQILFLTLERLRLNLSFRFLSYEFNTTIKTISKHFRSCLLIMYSKLHGFDYWPNRDAIKKTMPLAFQKQFGDTIVIVIDCFEIFIERPTNVKAAAQCYSSYKHAMTVKYLIGITPQGFIAFISNGFGGRASDKFVTEKCGLLDHLVAGDVVMADRGFLIEEELKRRCVELQIPPFTKGKSQLHPIEVEETRKSANVRIHVERIIGQLRQKFSILHQFKFPISLIKKKGPSSVSTIDQIVRVCSALSNICSPIVCKEEQA